MPAVWTLTTLVLVLGIALIVILIRRLDETASRLARQASLVADIRRELPALRLAAERLRADAGRVDRRVTTPRPDRRSRS